MKLPVNSVGKYIFDAEVVHEFLMDQDIDVICNQREIVNNSDVKLPTSDISVNNFLASHKI